jgi:hypothetical protein
MTRHFPLTLAMAASVALAVAPGTTRAQNRDSLGGLLGGSDVLRIAEGILEKELPKRVAPARDYRVHLGQAGTNLATGLLGSAEVTALDVRAGEGLVIPRINLRLQDVKVDIANRSLERIGKAFLSATLDDEAVTKYIKRAGSGDIQNLKVAFRGNTVFVSGAPQVNGIRLPSQVEGKPVLRGHRHVDFQAKRASVFGISLPESALNELEKKINPVVDLSGLKLPVRITKVAVKNSRLVIDARGELDEKDLQRLR